MLIYLGLSTLIG